MKFQNVKETLNWNCSLLEFEKILRNLKSTYPNVRLTIIIAPGNDDFRLLWLLRKNTDVHQKYTFRQFIQTLSRLSLRLNT